MRDLYLFSLSMQKCGRNLMLVSQTDDPRLCPFPAKMKPASSLCRLPSFSSSSIISNPVKNSLPYDFSGFRIPKPPFFVGSMFRNLSVSLLLPADPCFLLRGKENLPPQFRPAIIGRNYSANSSSTPSPPGRVLAGRERKRQVRIFNNDSTITTTVLDRLLHDCEAIKIQGKS